jgi:hypothetical protein
MALLLSLYIAVTLYGNVTFYDIIILKGAAPYMLFLPCMEITLDIVI